MSDAQIIGVIISLALLAFGLALKSAQDQVSLNDKDKNLQRSLSELETVKKHNDETIAGISQSHAATVKELSERIEQLEKKIKHQVVPLSSQRVGGKDSWMG